MEFVKVQALLGGVEKPVLIPVLFLASCTRKPGPRPQRGQKSSPWVRVNSLGLGG